MPTRRRRRRGVSLVEVMVALAVLTFGVYAIHDQFLATRDLGLSHLDRTRARYLAHQKLEELRAAGHGALAAWAPREAAMAPAYAPFRDVTRLDPSPLRFHYRVALAKGAANEPIGVTVDVRWDRLAASTPEPLEGYSLQVQSRIYP